MAAPLKILLTPVSSCGARANLTTLTFPRAAACAPSIGGFRSGPSGGSSFTPRRTGGPPHRIPVTTGVTLTSRRLALAYVGICVLAVALYLTFGGLSHRTVTTNANIGYGPVRSSSAPTAHVPEIKQPPLPAHTVSDADIIWHN